MIYEIFKLILDTVKPLISAQGAYLFLGVQWGRLLQEGRLFEDGAYSESKIPNQIYFFLLKNDLKGSKTNPKPI